MTQEILEVFTETILAREGKVTDTFHQHGQLFVRSVFPQTEQIRAADKVQGGVALRATETTAWVYPYVFRLVCKNGAILAHAVEGREISHLDSVPALEAVSRVREAVEACCERNAFLTAAGQMRTAARQPVDVILNMMPFLSRLSSLAPGLVQQVFKQLFHENDRTRYGFMNAVTAVARDTRDPQTRWQLEELGGQVAVTCRMNPVLDDGAAEHLPDDGHGLPLAV